MKSNALRCTLRVATWIAVGVVLVIVVATLAFILYLVYYGDKLADNCCGRRKRFVSSSLEKDYITTLKSHSNAFMNENLTFEHPEKNNMAFWIKKNPSSNGLRIQEMALETRFIVPSIIERMFNEFVEYARNDSKYSFSYRHIHNVKDFINLRSLTNRPLAFIGSRDYTRLRYEKGFSSLYNEWTNNDNPVDISEYLSYEEMMFNALIGVSGPTFFLNDCDMKNRGIEKRSNPSSPSSNTVNHIEEGIIVGQVGPRFERLDQMESRYLLFPPPTNLNYADRLFYKYFGISDLLTDKDLQRTIRKTVKKIKGKERYDAPVSSPFFIKHNGKEYEFVYIRDRKITLNITALRYRMRLSIGTLLGEANARAKKESKKAHVICVPLGGGEWKIYQKQNDILADEIIKLIKESDYDCISTVDLRYFSSFKNEEKRMITNRQDIIIKLRCGNEAPTALYDSKRHRIVNENDLVVLNYAWDSNAFPGNEYWIGDLDTSGDPAAACCSLITELHNPYINTLLVKERENDENIKFYDI